MQILRIRFVIYLHHLLKMNSGNGISASREGHGYFHTSEL